MQKGGFIANPSVSTVLLFLAAKATHSQTLSSRHTLEIDLGIDKIHINTYNNCDFSHFFLGVQPLLQA